MLTAVIRKPQGLSSLKRSVKKKARAFFLSALNVAVDDCVMLPGSDCNSAEEITSFKKPL